MDLGNRDNERIDWVGVAAGNGLQCTHNPGYDFNDDIIPLGASYWVTLVEQVLPTE